jgi:two-component system CheB/CheR fusion protein
VSLAESKGLTFRVVPSEASARADVSLVTQILRNLLTNAIKYTRAGWVALRCLHEQSSVRLEVLDTGIGIRADKLQYIYDEFYQIRVPSNSTRDGYGLGLSIVQRIASLLNAKLDVRSEFGKGSLFALTLPVANCARPRLRAVTQQIAAAEASRARVLLVEDDQAVRNATHMLLRSEGFQVIAADSLEDALHQAAGEEQIDLLVTDYHLQDGKTGMEVISAVRSLINPRLKALLLTGDTSSAIGQLSRDELMRVASKPINSEHLISLLKSLLASDHPSAPDGVRLPGAGLSAAPADGFE